MSAKLLLTVTPRHDDEGYDHMDIDLPDVRVGSVRYRAMGRRAVIYSIQVFPEFQGNGYGRQVIDDFKSRYAVLVADRVRYTARMFWEKMGFEKLPNDDNFEHQWRWTAGQPS